MHKGICILLLIGTATTTTGLFGQDHRLPLQEANVAVTYDAVQSPESGSGNFWQQGGSVNAFVGFYRNLGVAADFAATHAGDISGNGADLTLSTYLFGPRYAWPVPWTIPRTRTHGEVFGEFLIGGAHGSDGIFPTPQGVASSASSFAMQFGGGVDLPVAKRVEVRPLQLDWLRTQLPNGRDNVQQNVRIGIGVVFRLTGSRKTQPGQTRSTAAAPDGQ